MRWSFILLIILFCIPVIASAAFDDNTNSFRVDINPKNITYDISNGTYTHFWINATVLDIPVAGFVWSLLLPLFTFLGWWLFPIIFFIFMMGIYLRTQEVGLPLISGAIASTVMGVFFPWEAKIIAGLVFALCLAGLLVHVYYGQYD